MASQINLTWNFAIPVFFKQVEDFGTIRQQLLDLIYRKKEESLASSNPNYMAGTWQTGYDMHLWQEPVITDLLALIGEFSSECINSCTNYHTLKGDVLITGCRASVRGYTAWSSPHQHIAEHWAGVLYVDVEDCLNDAEQPDLGGRIELLNPNRLAKLSGFQSSVAHTPKDGLIVLFPGYLEHMIHPNLSHHDRVAINFFINVRPSGVLL